MNDFTLHPRLMGDCLSLGSLELCRVLLMNDRTYPWLILVPQRAGITEIFELPEADQQRLIAESSCVARALMDVFRPDKLNIAAIGNLVPQLHIHHVARFRTDLFMSPLFRSQAYPTWVKQGSRTADDVATDQWQALLESYQDPGIDEALDAELREFIDRKAAELDG
jgi:diadenosine tetraphosphate (Ap4A) HIT family hydrolase